MVFEEGVHSDVSGRGKAVYYLNIVSLQGQNFYLDGNLRDQGEFGAAYTEPATVQME